MGVHSGINRNKGLKSGERMEELWLENANKKEESESLSPLKEVLENGEGYVGMKIPEGREHKQRSLVLLRGGLLTTVKTVDR